MAEQPISTELQNGVADFAVLIAWSGPEDKPFYRALLVSPSRAQLVENKPFWGYAVIGADELRRLVNTLQDQRRTLVEGPHRADRSEYYVEIDLQGRVYSCSLGFDQATLRTLGELALALAPEHQRPIQDIESRLRPGLEQRST